MDVTEKLDYYGRYMMSLDVGKSSYEMDRIIKTMISESLPLSRKVDILFWDLWTMASDKREG